jgi:hypothetical protein
MIKLSLKSWYLIDRYPARHPPSGSLQSGQLIGSLVRGGGGATVRGFSRPGHVLVSS